MALLSNSYLSLTLKIIAFSIHKHVVDDDDGKENGIDMNVMEDSTETKRLEMDAKNRFSIECQTAVFNAVFNPTYLIKHGIKESYLVPVSHYFQSCIEKN